MIAELRIADEKMAAMVLRLQRRAYAIEAQLIGSTALPPLHDAIAFLAIFKANGSLGRSPMSEAARRFTFAG